MKFKTNLVLTLLINIWACTQNLSAQLNPSDSINIYLITASPGDETYAAFGHSAIRVSFPLKNINYVFNYGTFNFSTPNFYFKFATGRLMYSLSVADYQQFLLSYQSWGQALYEQKFLLTQKETHKFYNLLIENFKEENRYYRYSFFYDNCATRIRDIVEKSVDGNVVYNDTFAFDNQTFRDLITPYLDNTPWIFFGINILLGTGTDNVAKPAQYMFLPDYLKDKFVLAEITNNTTRRNLTDQPVELFPTTLEFEDPSIVSSPNSVFSVIAILVIILGYFELRRKWNLVWLDRLLFIITGLLGLLLTFLWIWSLHRELENNFNIVWASPLNLLIGILLFFKPTGKTLKWSVITYLIAIILFLPVSIFLTQSFPFAVYSICIILAIRALIIYRRGKKLTKINIQ